MSAFTDAALSSLTAKIDKKLSEQKAGNNPKPADNSKSAGKAKPGGKQKPTDKPKSTDKPKPADKPKPSQPAQPQANLKRKRQEEKTEQASNKKDKKDTSSKPSGKQNRPNKSEQNGKPPAPKKGQGPNALLDEIMALGGDEKDLELVGDVDSEDETYGDQKGGDKDLQAELAKFASGLGFEKVQPEEAAEEEEEEEEDEEEAPQQDEEWEEASSEEDEPESKDELALKAKRKTIFEARADWHATELRELPEPKSDHVAPFLPAINSLKTYAASLLEEDMAAYSKTLSASSSHKFMSTIMSSGTISDKTSALTLAIQESPVHSIKLLENLMGLAAKRSRGQALAAAAALVDLLGPGNILPPNRRLRPFTAQTGLTGTLQKFNTKSWSSNQQLPGKINKEHLIYWAFEDWLKDAYFKIIQTLETWCDDEVEYSRVRSIDMVYALLKEKPEQEANLLRLLVNKLGDRERKIASRASYLLLQLVNLHPGMKAVVIRSVEQEIIFKPGQSVRAKYYAVNTLNQTILSSKEPQIADSLLKIYFGMFVSLLKTGALAEESDKDANVGQGEREAAEKLVSAILTGINRAVPFSETDSSTLESHLDTLFRITHSSNFNTSIQALMLIQQLVATKHLATERFYRTLYESLLDTRLATSSKQALYLNLLYRSLKADVDVRRVKAFVKRMLQILHLQQPSFVCGILYLTMELYGVFPGLKSLLTDPEEHDDLPDASPEDDAVTDGLNSAIPKDAYDGRKRNPEYSNAHLSCLWELVPFLNHYHPSVDVYAKSLLNGLKPAQKPDLANHTLIHFLDKFVYRNPKASDGMKGNSLMQPVAATGQSQILLSSKPTHKTGAPLNSASFWNKKAGDVAVEDVFFHEYFNQIGKPAQAERAKKAKVSAEEGAEADESGDEEEIWNALTASRPEVEIDDESDVGSDFEDLMSLDGSDEEAGGDAEEDMDVDGMSEGSAPDFSDVSSLGFSDEDDEEGGAAVAEDKEDDKKPQSERTKRKKMLRSLPTFATADDYAAMLAEEDEGDY
ncbi:uncharacterized protein PG986_013177 [Apiospora aurea]|uniref:CCAAT-binding factor domain-containing protein n=1 Tax=Apiospora aurea TaxID=335848 RepID=A0ABR1PVV8_9PEZI